MKTQYEKDVEELTLIFEQAFNELGTVQFTEDGMDIFYNKLVEISATNDSAILKEVLEDW
jgi:hypothetical protein